MRNLMFLFCCLCFTVQLSAATEVVETTDNLAIEMVVDMTAADMEFDANCTIIQIDTSCGGSYSTQYCDGGSHGDSPIDWAMQVDEWDCGGE